MRTGARPAAPPVVPPVPPKWEYAFGLKCAKLRRVTPDSLLVILAGALGLALGVPLALLAERMLQSPRRLGWRTRATAGVSAAALFVFLTGQFGFSPQLAPFLIFATASVVLCIVDLVEKRLPNVIVLPTTAVVLVSLALAAVVDDHLEALFGALLGGTVFFSVYLVLVLVSPNGIGMGDVKLSVMIGLALGYLGWSTVLLGLFAGFLVGGIISLLALAVRKVTLGSSIPFGPSMLLGAFIAILLPTWL